MEQKVVEFFASGTIGAGKDRALEGVVARVNKEGWRVDQIVPTDFSSSEMNRKSLEMRRGVLLCSKI